METRCEYKCLLEKLCGKIYKFLSHKSIKLTSLLCRLFLRRQKHRWEDNVKVYPEERVEL